MRLNGVRFGVVACILLGREGLLLNHEQLSRHYWVDWGVRKRMAGNVTSPAALGSVSRALVVSLTPAKSIDCVSA
jgi:hypothetical protein